MTYTTPMEALAAVQPICKNCKHYVESEWDAPRCARTSTYTASNVTGKITEKLFNCSSEREYTDKNSCGPKARFFEQAEPKEPSLIQKAFAWLTPDGLIDEGDL